MPMQPLIFYSIWSSLIFCTFILWIYIKSVRYNYLIFLGILFIFRKILRGIFLDSLSAKTGVSPLKMTTANGLQARKGTNGFILLHTSRSGSLCSSSRVDFELGPLDPRGGGGVQGSPWNPYQVLHPNIFSPLTRLKNKYFNLVKNI